ncbi:MAG: hypothetical protein GF409_02115 [Candidatus Omnitrophica bacterium]|nr:hypothetical protein [Candidatus Omnitrophota bacterium]
MPGMCPQQVMSFGKRFISGGFQVMKKIVSKSIHKKINLLAFFLIACLICSSCGLEDLSGEGYRIRDVVDGDTAELATGQKIRYLGVDTPEIMKKFSGNWIFDPEPLALEAKAFNRALVSGRRVDLEFDEKRVDKYGRWLVYVIVNGKLANAELLREGYAYLMVYPPNDKYLEELLQAQSKAKNAKLGLWKEMRTIPPEEAHRYAGRLVTLKCKIQEVTSSRRAAVLLKTGVTGLEVIIYGGNLKYFTDMPVSRYRGEELEITGKIRKRNGLELVVYHPSQIRVMSK